MPDEIVKAFDSKYLFEPKGSFNCVVVYCKNVLGLRQIKIFCFYLKVTFFKIYQKVSKYLGY